MSRIARILFASLMFLPLVVDFPRAQAQAPGPQARQKKPKPSLTPVQRFEKAVGARPKPNPVLPVLMHSLERHLQGAGDPSVMDQAVQRALSRHPALQRKVLETWVDNWKAVPSATKAKVVPPELLNLEPAHKLDMRMFTNVVQRTAPTLRPTAAPHPLPSPAAPFGALASVPGGTSRRILIPVTTETWFTAWRRPYIDRIEPRTPHLVPRFGPGQSFTIFGRNFSTDVTQNVIQVLRRRRQPDGRVTADLVRTITPSRAAADRLEAVMVRGVVPGTYDFAVKVTNIGTTNHREVWITQMPPPRPTIQSVSPQPQYPGRRVLVTGSNFGANTSFYWELLDYGGAHYATSRDIRRLSPTQLELTIPQSVLPGHYRIAAWTHLADTSSPLSEWVTVTVKAPQYRVEFTNMTCLDESNPERLCLPIVGCTNAYHDELVTFWAISADADVWAKNTGEYGEFDEPEVKNYAGNDRFIFPIEADQSRQVRQVLFIGTTLFEWDAGDVRAAQDALGFLADLAPEIGTAIGSLFGSPEAGGEAGEIVAKVLEAVSILIGWLGGDPDGLGEKDLSWTALDLQARTANPTQSFGGTLSFLNSDDVGSYRLAYTVRRFEP